MCLLLLQPSQAGGNQVELSQDFLVLWNYFYTSVEKEIALLQGKSFGKFTVSGTDGRMCCIMFCMVQHLSM